MKVAFYKGTKTGMAGVYNRGVRRIEHGKYSHCELVFSNGESASASYMDGGVRFKDIPYDNDNWDFVDVSWADEKFARDYFTRHVQAGTKYDIKGNIHFLFGFVGDSSTGKFCSETIADALDLKEGWRYAPNALYQILVLMHEQIVNKPIKAIVSETKKPVHRKPRKPSTAKNKIT